MKIKNFSIINFRSVSELVVEFPKSGILALVGPNNAGKSNVLRAVNSILGEQWFSGERAELNDYYGKNKENTIKIDINFDNNRRVEFNSSQKWPIYYDENGGKIFGSNGNIKDDFPSTYLEANRSIEKSLQFKSWELMGKIAKVFNERARDKQEKLEEKFNEVMDILDEVNGFKEFKEDFISFFDDMQSVSPYKLKVTFRAFTPLNYFKSINIIANDSSINDLYDTDIIELGEGNKNLIMFALIRSYAKNFKQEATGLLAIEEPEIYLHPQARRHLFSVFKQIVRDSNIQIIYTTHSSSFVRIEDFSSIGLVTKSKDEGTKICLVTEQQLVKFCTDTGASATKVTNESIIEYYSTISNYRLNEAFFGKVVILVEGETEEMAFPVYLRSAGIDCDSEGITIISVQGKNQLPKYWRLFYSLGIPLVVVFDNDNIPNKAKSNQNLASCFNINVDILKKVDVYTTIDSNKENVFKQKLIVLENCFEVSLEKDLKKYCENNNFVFKYNEFNDNAKEYIKPLENTQKGQMARYIAKKIVEEYKNYVPTFISEIIKETVVKSDNSGDNHDLPF